MDLSAAFVTLDTTGLPGRIPGFKPRIVALGLAMTHQGELVYATGGLIHQAPDHVTNPLTSGAWRANGIDPDLVIASPMGEQELAKSLCETIRGCTLRGYNVDFLSKFLCEPPFNLHKKLWGACVMEEAQTRMNASPLCETRPLIGHKYPSLNEALFWASAHGHDVLPPDDVTNRAHVNAVRVAKLALALEKGE